jgi:hypothetical protein
MLYFIQTIKKDTLTGILTGCLLLLFSFSSLVAQEKHALLIGIDKYNYESSANMSNMRDAEAPAPRKWSDLRGAVNDANNMKEILVSRFAFDRNNIRTLFNEQATREQILAAIETYIIENPKEGDEVFFYYAGHGSQVPNSLSDEANKMDETLVPTDAFFGAPDIRDKELRKLFNKALDKGVRLTLVFDSCHSGSITRGVPSGIAERKIEPATYDVADASLNNLPSPEERGALVLSSARDEQTAKERFNPQTESVTGIFTDTLIRVLRESQPNEPISRVMSRVQAIVKTTISDQDPVLAGTDERVNAPLFGDSDTIDNAIYAAVTQKTGNIVVLQGGRSIGLNKGAILRHFTAGDNPAEIRVTQLNQLTEAITEIVSGDGSAVKEGDLFEVITFGISEGQSFNVYIPQVAGNAETLVALARQAHQQASANNIPWVVDPVRESTAFTYVHHTGSGWTSEYFGSDPVSGSLTEAVSVRLGSDASTPVFLHLPPTEEIKSNFDFVKEDISIIRLVDDRAQADYVLTGIYDPSKDEILYSWIRPNATIDDARSSVFPLITTPVSISSNNPHIELNRQINGISRIKGWLDLEAPPGGKFPFRLGFRNTATNEIVESGHLGVGNHEMILINTMGPHPQSFDSHHVYVFFADNTGRIGLLYPTTSSSSAMPTATMINSDEGIPETVSLMTIPVESPFAVNTIFMLTSKTAISNTRVFNQPPVVGERSGTRGTSSLENLITDRNTATRTFGSPPIIDWSLSRVFVTTGSK